MLASTINGGSTTAIREWQPDTHGESHDDEDVRFGDGRAVLGIKRCRTFQRTILSREANQDHCACGAREPATTFRPVWPRKSSRRSSGQPVVVENRPGAGGAIAAREVAKARPDGYTLLMGNTSTLAVIPAVSTNAGYDPVSNFTPIARITEGFQVLVVHPSSAWTSIRELIDYAKANPGKLNYAHVGPGGLPHLAGELFMLRSGTTMTGISYRSGGESVTAVLSHAVHLTFEHIAILWPQVREGTLRALAAQTARAPSSCPLCRRWPRSGSRTPRPIPSSVLSRRPEHPGTSSRCSMKR